VSREVDLPDAGTSGEIAGYRLDGYIGGSDAGAVYLARKERRDRQVALKVLAPERAGEAAFRARLIRDSQTATTVQHPNIIPVYQAGDADGTVYVAMRYAPGGDTRSLLNRLGPLPLDLAGTIVTQIGSALDAAHAQGLIHRDVKPANILLGAGQVTGDGLPDQAAGLYLSDFGMAPDTSLKEVITAGQLTSRLDYVAPEQIEGLALDGRADLYSLACVGFELLCGTPLFEADQGLTVMYAQLYAPPPAASARRTDLPAAVDHVLAKALAKNPADRYPTCTQFAQDLSEALALTRRPPPRAPSRLPFLVLRAPVAPAPVAPAPVAPAPVQVAPAALASPKPSAPESDHAEPAPEQPPAGPGEPSGENEAPPVDPQPSSRRRGPVKLLVAAGAVVIVAAAAVAIGVSATGPGHPAAHAAVASRPTATSAATSTPAPTPSPSSSPTLSASAQAAVVSKLLTSSAATRQQLRGAVNEVASCTNLTGAVGIMQSVVSQRSAEYRQASALPASALPQDAAVKTDLVAMFRTSITADQDYLAWARQQLTAGCTAPLQSSAYSAANSAAQPAGTAKETFIQLWNPIAATYGIAPQSSSSI
jgi:tRNA A-37 threonylcarbamoyl transferase component Bud32